MRPLLSEKSCKITKELSARKNDQCRSQPHIPCTPTAYNSVFRLDGCSAVLQATKRTWSSTSDSELPFGKVESENQSFGYTTTT